MDERELLNQMPSESTSDIITPEQTPEMEVENDG